jgi:hypothetical protein
LVGRVRRHTGRWRLISRERIGAAARQRSCHAQADESREAPPRHHVLWHCRPPPAPGASPPGYVNCADRARQHTAPPRRRASPRSPRGGQAQGGPAASPARGPRRPSRLGRGRRRLGRRRVRHRLF